VHILVCALSIKIMNSMNNIKHNIYSACVKYFLVFLNDRSLDPCCLCVGLLQAVWQCDKSTVVIFITKLIKLIIFIKLCNKYVPHTNSVMDVGALLHSKLFFTSILITSILNLPKCSDPYVRWPTPFLLLIFIIAIFHIT